MFSLRTEHSLSGSTQSCGKRVFSCWTIRLKGPDGTVVTCPSTSPENSFFTPTAREAAVSVASTLDTWLTRVLYLHCIRGLGYPRLRRGA